MKEIDYIVGAKREVLNYIFQSCLIPNTNITKKITNGDIRENISGYHSETTPDALRKLVKEKVLNLANYKKGFRGWKQYEINENIYNQLKEINEVSIITITKIEYEELQEFKEKYLAIKEYILGS